jgi:hypothetical protein
VDGQASPEDLSQVVLGPALILALALQGVWCLHASAVVFGDTAVIFAGESGWGKSTLARYLGEQAGWRRAADDVLPVVPVGNGLMALPHFPQLKLPSGAQPANGLPQRLPVAAVYVLDRDQKETGEAITILGLNERDAALALIRHTVAARLFGPDLLRQHMAFCAKVAGQVPVRLLRYPRQFAWLPELRDRLAADLAQVDGGQSEKEAS